MVAETIALPNVKDLFIPDPGYIIADIDLDRADLQVVVWEAGDEELKSLLRRGIDMHIVNAMLLEGQPLPPEDELIEGHPQYKEHKARCGSNRARAKMMCHAMNYGVGARTMARGLGITVKRAEYYRNRWFSAHPSIKRWHERVEESLMNTRSVSNKFGYRRFYFDRIAGLLPEALAWIPQSTVANITNQGIVNLTTHLPTVHVLLQVHDSIVLQYPRNLHPTILPRIREQVLITVPYDDPLVIPVGIKVSEKSWGDCKAVPWE